MPLLTATAAMDVSGRTRGPAGETVPGTGGRTLHASSYGVRFRVRDWVYYQNSLRIMVSKKGLLTALYTHRRST